MANPKLRTATSADLRAVKALVTAAYTPWIDVIGAIPGPLRADYAHSISQARVQVLDGPHGIEALVVLIPLPDALLLDNIAVAPSAQGQGLGRHLLDATELVAQAQGYKAIRLYAHEKMIANIRLYQRRGYTITHRVAEGGLPRVYMEKPVPSSEGRPPGQI